MDKQQHLPMFGVGPFYVAAIIGATAAGIWLSASGKIPAASFGVLRLPLALLGGALIAAGVFLWYSAVIRARVDDHIRANTLATSGVYAWTRNPIYAAFLLACTGALLIAGNAWLMPLSLLFWGFLTVLMKRTEEKWLAVLHGEAYREYCRRVNRCIPWPPKK